MGYVWLKLSCPVEIFLHYYPAVVLCKCIAWAYRKRWQSRELYKIYNIIDLFNSFFNRGLRYCFGALMAHSLVNDLNILDTVPKGLSAQYSVGTMQ